ncbi:MAG: polyheme membrane-associated cytochrome C [Granulosicoccus sp.]|nr:polyheme membrane-associated cytochrome C [Granulosicoccus sp.]
MWLRVLGEFVSRAHQASTCRPRPPGLWRDLPGAIGLLLASGFLAPVQVYADEPAIESLWSGSAHADDSSESFRHWDKEGEIPTGCASCHSTTGFLDFLGEDGSAAGTVEHAARTGTVIECASCHNDALRQLDKVVFPSGLSVTDTGTSTSCTLCHQGRMSTPGVNENLEALPDDGVSADLSFMNIHYRAAAASLYGSEVRGGYEYAGKAYAARFTHPEPLNNCVGCHDPHALSVRSQQCTECHEGIAEDQLASIRLGSPDHDGDGDTTAGVSVELANLHRLLYDAITLYATGVSKSPVVYDSGSYPYFFQDTDANGQVDEGEAVFPNRYQSWTPRLLRAAYNYQFVAKDPGSWAHNPRYAAQLLIDSIEDLQESIDLDTPAMIRQ